MATDPLTGNPVNGPDPGSLTTTDVTPSTTTGAAADPQTMPVDFKAGFVANSGANIDPNLRENPQFDPITSRPSYFQGSSIARGAMVSDPIARAGSPIVLLNFLYNPTRYTVGYSMNAQVFPAIYQPQTPAPSLINGISMSFDILFDRVADCWKDAFNPGVMIDLYILEKLTGVNESGTLNSYPINVYFAATGISNSVKFYGIITSLGITFTLFNRLMIPTQCICNITMEQRYQPSGVDSSNTGASTDSSAGSGSTDSSSSQTNNTR